MRPNSCFTAKILPREEILLPDEKVSRYICSLDVSALSVSEGDRERKSTEEA